jgi:hypothetical protein
MEDSVLAIKSQIPEEKAKGFQVEYEILPLVAFDKKYSDPRRFEIAKKIANIDARTAELQNRIDILNTKIERFTNHADTFDYTIAVGAGILCGLIDSFFVGEFNFKKAKGKTDQQVNKFITKFAKLNGYTGDRLKGAINFLEGQFPVAQDNIFKGAKIGVSAADHHLADFAHHPTLLGLAAAVAVQFFRVGIFSNKNGEWHFKFISTQPKELLKIWLPMIISGLLAWMINIAESKYKDKIDAKIPQPIQKLIKALAAAPAIISILKVAINWAGHLVSDMGGSKNTAGGGMGIAGLFISLLHEIAAVPPLNSTNLPKLVHDLYVKEKWDMRSELAVLNELGRQAVPVIIGEILVRTFYFVRRLIQEYDRHKKLEDINWKNVIPFNNRTIVRMMTIESGTFMAVDLADAAIRAAIESGPPTTPAFWSKFILKVNFVGVGRFFIAVGADAGMGIKRQRLIKERMFYRNQNGMLQIAKLFYLQEGMWVEAIDTEKAINTMCIIAENSMVYFVQSYSDIVKSIENIGDNVSKIEEKNPGLIDDIKDTLEWG